MLPPVMERKSCCGIGPGLGMKRSGWSPYVVGAGMGVLSWLVFLVVNKPLGMSTEVSKFSGWVAGLFMGMEAVSENAYWAKEAPKFGYSTVFLIATAIGAFLSAKLGGTFQWEMVPRVWREERGSGAGGRMVAAFLGGMALLYGARMAGGCTSGHGISGTLQLAASGWIFFAAMFASGIVTARLLFRRR